MSSWIQPLVGASIHQQLHQKASASPPTSLWQAGLGRTQAVPLFPLTEVEAERPNGKQNSFKGRQEPAGQHLTTPLARQQALASDLHLSSVLGVGLCQAMLSSSDTGSIPGESGAPQWAPAVRPCS